VRAALREVDPTLGILNLQTMPAIMRQSLWQARLFSRTFGTFAAAAIVLALVGVYGVVAYTVAERTRELGVRLALGARPKDVYRVVLGGSARLAALGLGVGTALALALTQVLASALPNVSPRDPSVLLGVIVSLGAATLVASWAPARRATRLDPVVSLRTE
jgi:ABC-type antimicrobial peptide transport system permease subunit